MSCCFMVSQLLKVFSKFLGNVLSNYVKMKIEIIILSFIIHLYIVQ